VKRGVLPEPTPTAALSYATFSLLTGMISKKKEM
jgi:hypothetical protein